MPENPWVERQRRTGRLIRACYDDCIAGGNPSAEQLHALCKLAWITKGAGDIADNTRSVVAPALSVLMGLNIMADAPRSLANELTAAGVGPVITGQLTKPIGMVNFYAAFRNSSVDWLKSNRTPVWAILRAVAEAKGDNAVLDAYRKLESLPALPRTGGANMVPDSLLTPVLASLDPRGRAPIINARKDVRAKLRRLGLSHASLGEQCRGLMNLINQEGLRDAFDLDTTNADDLEWAFAQKKAKPSARSAPHRHSKPLQDRRDEDLEFLRKARMVKCRQLHNTMTTALKRICDTMGLATKEGSDRAYLFDVLIERYLGTERSLLVEVKTDGAAPFVRMAVGQLLDYRRFLPERAATDLAVLLPKKPPAATLGFLEDVSVAALWFVDGFTKIEGDVVFDPGV